MSLKPLKILILSHSFYPHIGGIEVNSEIFAECFTEAGHIVRLITWSNTLAEKDYSYTVLRSPGFIMLAQQHAWSDVVFENNPCLRLSWPNIFFSRPSVIVLNTWIARIDGSVGIQDVLKKLWLKRAKEVISVSNAVRLRCWPSATVIGNPYRASKFRLMADVSRDRDFIFLGRLVSDKGADQAIHAIAQLLNEGEDSPVLAGTSLTIVGDGPELENLKRLTSKLRINKHIHFTGSLEGDDLVTCLNRHKFLLVPSLWEEPFGNVVLEGMACGCLPIASNGGGLPDAVGKAGITFQRGNLKDLIECMSSVLRNPEKEQRLRNESKSHLLQHHPELVSRRYLEVIESVV